MGKRGNSVRRNGLIPLQSRYVYGPIDSRRLGNSLGINPFPLGKKICSFNCIYCQYGFTTAGIFSDGKAKNGFPDIETLKFSLSTKLKNLKESGIKLDFITFAGNGEPTLYPEFPRLVDAVKELRDEYYPGAKTAILSNSTLAIFPKIREGLNRLDERIMKLDVGTEELLRRVNDPVDRMTLQEIITGLKELKDCILQSLFIKGSASNSDDDSVMEWIEAVRLVRPKFVQVYSIDRVPADRGIEIVEREELEEIARRLTAETGTPSGVY
ncbi:MAG: radical SAM protein [Acidobacteriota bacterium]